MRSYTCVLFLVLGLALQVASQISNSNSPSSAVTPTVTVSGTNSVTPSLTVTNSVSPSTSGSLTKTGSPSVTNSGSVTVTRTWTPSTSLSATPSTTASAHPPPTGLANLCLHHIINICPGWSQPAGENYVLFIVTVSNSSSTSTFTTSKTSVRITNLAPNSTYQVTVQGVEANGVSSLVSAPVSMTTDPVDAKINPNEDIHNITCTASKGTTGRGIITCNWLAASPIPPNRLTIKWRCVSAVRKPDSNKKRLFKAAAALTSITLHINRDVSTCSVYFHAYYPRRPATRHTLTVIVGI